MQSKAKGSGAFKKSCDIFSGGKMVFVLLRLTYFECTLYLLSIMIAPFFLFCFVFLLFSFLFFPFLSSVVLC